MAAEAAIRPVDWNIALAILGLAGMVSAAFAFRSDPPPRLERLAVLAAVLFPAYVAMQVVPLPLFLLRILDPARAEIADSLRGVMPGLGLAPLSIVPAETYVYISRMAGYVLGFLVIRESARQLTNSRWAPAIPLMVFGGLEAALGLSQHSAKAEAILGTYASKDHFAGLLEMVLPLVLMYGMAILYRGREWGAFASSSVMKASALFALAVGIFVAIVFSFSKMGFLSALGSLFVMGVLGWGVRLGGRKKWAAVCGLAALAVLVFVFLPPQELVNRFAGLASDQTTEGRVPIAQDTLHIIAAYPLFGSGLGTYYPALLRYQTSILDFAVLNAHNDYLQLLAELGIAGKQGHQIL